MSSPFFIAKPWVRWDEIYKKDEKKNIKQEKSPQKPKYFEIAVSSGMTLLSNKLWDIYMVRVSLRSWVRAVSLGSPITWDEYTGEPLYAKRNIRDLRESIRLPIHVAINGQFFDPNKNPTPLSFWLKEWDEVRTVWADNRDEEKNIIVFASWYAQILPYSWENLKNAKWDMAIVGLATWTKKQYHSSLWRTYLCLRNPDKTNTSSELLIFLALGTSEYAAQRIIFASWCEKSSTIKLDASGSSQMIFGDMVIYGNTGKWSPDERKIPQAIGFYYSH
jgi:hypothetical protein